MLVFSITRATTLPLRWTAPTTIVLPVPPASAVIPGSPMTLLRRPQIRTRSSVTGSRVIAPSGAIPEGQCSQALALREIAAFRSPTQGAQYARNAVIALRKILSFR